MRLEHLSYLIEISKHTSLTSASENLFITPQALSIAIKTLESELGVSLITRSNKGIQLTKHGQFVCHLAQKIMANVEEINRYCLQNNTHPEIEGVLKIAACPVGASLFLPKMLLDFTTQYPNVNVITTEGPTLTILEDVACGQYDLGILNANYDFLNDTYHALTSQLDFHTFLTGQLSILCSKHSPVFEMKHISWEKACSYPMIITLTENVKAFNIYGLNTEKILPHKLYNYSNPLLCIETIAHTDFIGVAADSCLRYLPGSVRSYIKAIPLKEDISHGFFLATAKAAAQTPLLSAFTQIALKQYNG